MTTITIIKCDHCGNKITKPNKFVFGPWTGYDDDDEEEERPRKRSPHTAPIEPKITRIRIDLCNSCVPVWMERVKKLTGASDP